MADLIGRNLDDRISQALKVQAARPEPSAYTEHRALLQQALRPRQKCLAQVLASIPKANPDEDAGHSRLEDHRPEDCAPEPGRKPDVSVHWLPSCP